MASTEKRNIDTSKLTPEYLIPKIDLLGTTQLSIDAIPSVEELRYLGKENLEALKLTLRGQERKLRMANMKVGVAISLTNAGPEIWRTYRPIDTITEAEGMVAWEDFRKSIDGKSQPVLTNDLDFLKEFKSRLAATDAVSSVAKKPGVTYKCNYSPICGYKIGDTVLPTCRFSAYVAAWCRSEKAKHCNLPETGSCGNCHECTTSCHEESCVFTKANQEMINRCKKFLHGLCGRLKVSQDVVVAYIRRICAAINGAQSKPLFPMLRGRNWLKLGEVVVLQLVRPSRVSDDIELHNALVYGLKDPDAPVAQLRVLIGAKPPKMCEYNLGYGDPCIMHIGERDYLNKDTEFYEVWLRHCSNEYNIGYLEEVLKL